MATHQIQNVSLEFVLGQTGQTDAFILQDRVSELFLEHMSKQLSQRFDQLSPDGQQYVIESISLEVSVNDLNLEDWVDKVVRLMSDQVLHEIDKKRLGANENLQITSSAHSWLDQWLFYWKHGSPSWYSPKGFFDHPITLPEVQQARTEIIHQKKRILHQLKTPATFARFQESLVSEALSLFLDLVQPAVPEFQKLISWASTLHSMLMNAAISDAALKAFQWKTWIFTLQHEEEVTPKILLNEIFHLLYATWRKKGTHRSEAISEFINLVKEHSSAVPQPYSTLLNDTLLRWAEDQDNTTKKNKDPSAYGENVSSGSDNRFITQTNTAGTIDSEGSNEISKEESQESEGQRFLAHDAGIVLLHPFLQMLFVELGIYELGEGQLKSKDKAVGIMHYLVYGNASFRPHHIATIRLLCGIKREAVLHEAMISDAEKAECQQLLESVIRHWKILKKTSVEGLQVSFLQRQGKLELKEQEAVLQVEKEAYDVLLEHLPWSYGLIRLPWMQETLHVHWQNGTT